MFEKQSRCGGRVFTDIYDNSIVEYGVTYFDPRHDTHFLNLTKEFGIETVPVIPPKTIVNIPNLEKLSKKEREAVEITYRHLQPFHALIRYALDFILGDISIYKDPKSYIRHEATFLEKSLNEYGFWQLLTHILRKEAIDFVVKNGKYIDINSNAAEYICSVLDEIDSFDKNKLTIRGGLEYVIERLKERLRFKIKAFVNHELIEFVEKQGMIYLYFGNGSVVTTKRVVFCCEQNGLLKVRGFTQKIRECLETVDSVSLYTINVVVENPPFNASNVPYVNYNRDVIPCKDIYYGYNASSQYGLIKIHGDSQTLHFWRSFAKDNGSSPHKSEELRKQLNHDIKQLFPGNVYFKILYHGFVKWNSGAHLWKPMHCANNVISQLKSFGTEKSLHVCSEAFSLHQGTVEGSLTSVDTVIDSIVV